MSVRTGAMKKKSLLFLSGFIVGIFMINTILRFLGVPGFDEVLTFIFGSFI